MQPLADADFDPSRPVQTKKGAKQALRVGKNMVDELIKAGRLKTVEGLGRVTHITTESILKVASETNS
jgi:hypothetical protein